MTSVQEVFPVYSLFSSCVSRHADLPVNVVFAPVEGAALFVDDLFTARRGSFGGFFPPVESRNLANAVLLRLKAQCPAIM